MPDQRQYCVNLLIACSGPADKELISSRYGTMRSRNGTTLKHACADVELMDRVWASDFAPNIILENPTLDGVEDAIDRAHYYLRDYPTGRTGIDFYFAGHCGHDGGLVLKDGNLYARKFLDALSNYSSNDDGRLGFGFILDCCHSGAFLFKAIEELEKDNHRLRAKVRMYDALASSMHDEKSWEFDCLGHGVFTFSFSVRQNEGIDKIKLAEIINSTTCSSPIQLARLQDDILAMSHGPFSPNPTRLTSFLTNGRQNPLDCVNGHFLDAGARGVFPMSEIEEEVDVWMLMDKFSIH